MKHANGIEFQIWNFKETNKSDDEEDEERKKSYKSSTIDRI